MGTHLSTRPDGAITPCCRSRDTLGNIRDMTFEQAWNSERQQKLREDMLEGRRNQYCFQCWDMEDQGSVSMRQSMNKTRQTNFDNDQFVEDIVKLAPTIQVVEFAGGEPLMDPLHYKVLEALEPFGNNISVKYSTNLSKLKFGKFDTLSSWSKFKGVDLSLSIDGHPVLNDYIRTESDTKVLAQNLRDVKRELGGKYKGR